MDEQRVHVLLVDDDEIDREAARRVFSRAGIEDRLTLVDGADDGLSALRSNEPRLPRPLLVLLDLRMPGKSGLDFLRELRSDEQLRETSVIVTTISALDDDIGTAYDLGVEGYIIKPVGYEKLVASLAAADSDDTEGDI